jgi:UDP-glucose 4-epimerase
MYCQVFSRAYGLETVSLRYFNVFGPRQDATSPYSGVLALFIPAVLEGRPPTIYGDGEQSRDFVFVQNVVEANLLACEAPNAAGLALNIAGGTSITLNAMLAHITRLVGKEITPIYAEERAGDIKHSFADITEARKYLAYEPRVSFEEGLRQTIAWYKTQAAG